MGRGSSTALEIGSRTEHDLADYLGSPLQEAQLLDALQLIAPNLKSLTFETRRSGQATMSEGTILLPSPDDRLSPLENLLEITQTALHEAAHFRYTDSAADQALDKEAERFEAAGADASWKQILGSLMGLEDARIEEALLEEWPHLETLFRAEGSLDRIKRASLDVAGKTYYEYHFAILDASNPYSIAPRGIGRKAQKFARGAKEIIEFAVAGETTASAILSADALAKKLSESGKWLSKFSYGSTYLEDEVTVIGFSPETLAFARENMKFNPAKISSWRKRKPAFSQRELEEYLSSIAQRSGSAAEAQALLLPKL